jgi:hypothetical protein
MATFFSASTYAQQESVRPLFDAPLYSVLMEFDASKLAGDHRRAFDVLTLIITDTDHATTAEKRNGYLQEFLTRSQDFVKNQPDSLPLWLLRADAAIELDRSSEGRESARRLIELKAGDSNDRRVRRVLAMLDRKGWFGEEAPLVAGTLGAQSSFNSGAMSGPVPIVMPPLQDPKKPRARPVLVQPHTRPAVFMDNPVGTSNIGPVAYSAKWSKYGEYLHSMMEKIQVQWDRILVDSRTEPPSGTHVVIKFTMDLHGKITEIVNVDSTSSEQGKQSCITAITTNSPYGEWTGDMVAVLGTSQDLTFDFYYQ